MVDFRSDQAEGLRRLFGRRRARVITVASGSEGSGGTSAVINLAAVLAARGRRVLVIDEKPGSGNVAGALRIPVRRDLQDAIDGACALEDALVPAPCDITLMPAAQAVRGLGASPAAKGRLAAGLNRLSEQFDLILIDARHETAGELAAASAEAQEVIIVCSAGCAAITGAYALIKRLRGRHGRLRTHLLLNRVADERAARVIFDNLERLSRSRLEAGLELLGHVTRDEHLRRAARLFQPVVAAYPSAPAAAAFRHSAELLASAPAEHKRHPGLDRFLQRLLPGTSLVSANAGV